MIKNPGQYYNKTVTVLVSVSRVNDDNTCSVTILDKDGSLWNVRESDMKMPIDKILRILDTP